LKKLNIFAPKQAELPLAAQKEGYGQKNIKKPIFLGNISAPYASI